MNKTVIECNGIAAGYVKGLNILQGVDLIVNEKEIVSIIGPNGAGKSTLLKAIMGIINVSGGRFYINGNEKTNTPTHEIVREGVGYVPQVENVFPSLTIEENLEIGSWTLNSNIKESISKVFQDFPMLKERRRDKAGNLSGGQRQGVAVARAAAFGTKVIIMDEPTAALGVKESRRVLELIGEVKSRGIPIILISHNMPHVFEVSDRIHIHRLGKRLCVINPKDNSMSDAVAYMTGAKEPPTT